MVHLGILGAIVLATSQKETVHGTGSLWIIFGMGHHSSEYILAFYFLYINLRRNQYRT